MKKNLCWIGFSFQATLRSRTKPGRELRVQLLKAVHSERNHEIHTKLILWPYRYFDHRASGLSSTRRRKKSRSESRKTAADESNEPKW
jgi:hypothetical protein